MSERPLIYSKIALIKRDLGAIKKDKQVREGPVRFNFRGIDDVYNALHPILAEHGVFTTIELLDRKFETITRGNGKQAFQCVNLYRIYWWAEDGSSIHTDAIGEALDSGDKGSSKAASMAHKYGVLQTLLIPTEDMEDGDRTTTDVNEEKRAGGVPAVYRAKVVAWIRDKAKVDPKKVDMDTLLGKLVKAPPQNWAQILKTQHPELFQLEYDKDEESQ